MSKQKTALQQFIEHIATFDYIKGEWYVDVENGDIITSFVNFHLELEREQIIDFGEKCQLVKDVDFDGNVTFSFNLIQLFNDTFEQ